MQRTCLLFQVVLAAYLLAGALAKADLISSGRYGGYDTLRSPAPWADPRGMGNLGTYGADVFKTGMFPSDAEAAANFTRSQAYTLLVPVSFLLQTAQDEPTEPPAPAPKSLLPMGAGLMTTALLALRRAARKQPLGEPLLQSLAIGVSS